MKKTFIIILLFLSMCLWAQNVPQTIDYQGRLADSDGNYLNSVVTVDFLIYNATSGGTLLWNETQDVSTANGIFHVLLGSTVSFPTDLFDNADRWLELIVSGETLSPRTIVASVPYSIKAESAYSVEVPLNLSGNVSDPNSVIAGENTGTGFGVYGKNIGTGNYGYLGSTDYGVYGHHFWGNYGYLSSSDYGVYGHHIWGNYGYLGSSDYGVYGFNTSLVGKGVYGNSTGYYGGYFNSNYNSSGTHVIHAEFTGTGSSWNPTAVYGKSKPSDGYGNGGYFEGGFTGVIARVISTGSDTYIGVDCFAEGGSGTNYGIRGYGGSTGTAYAGYFIGNVHVAGTITSPSDERFKENVQLFGNALSKVKLMDVHTYNYIPMSEEKQFELPEGEQIGLIAQELEAILPQLVTDEVHAYDKNEGVEGAEKDMEKLEYKGINYIGLIPVLIEAIKEQQEMIEAQQIQNEEQQRQINELLRSTGN